MKKIFGLLWFALVFWACGESPSSSEKSAPLPPIPFAITDTLVDLQSHQLHFSYAKGRGIPILFNSGGGSELGVWKDLLPVLHDSLGAPLICYERAGIGKSSIDTVGINFEQEIIDLEQALVQLGYPQETFVVSHSLGGAYAHLYAFRNPQRIPGAVFIDASLPCFETEERIQRTVDFMASFGMEKIRAAPPGFYYIFKNYRAINERVKEIGYPKGIATTVIGADQPPNSAGPDSLAWKACQKEFGQWPGHRYVFAKDCSHQVFADNPQLVIDEIVRLYRKTGF